MYCNGDRTGSPWVAHGVTYKNGGNMNIKKLLAGGLTAIAAGATLGVGGFAALSDYVSDTTPPFVAIGNEVSSVDSIAAADIAAGMAGFVTNTVSVAASTAATTVSNGVDISSSTSKLYLGSALNKAKTTLTASDLPTLLAQGSTLVSGTTYTYDQYIDLGNVQISFGTSNGDLSQAAPIIDIGTAAGTKPAYNITIIFNKILNVSASTVLGKNLDVAGTSFTIGGTTNLATGTKANDKLVLFGAGTTVTLTESVPQTVNVDGTDYEVELAVISSASNVLVKVNGVSSDSIAAGGSDVVSGLNVYVKNVYYTGIAGTGTAVVNLGTRKLTLKNDSTVKLGADETSQDGTHVQMVYDNSGLSSLSVGVAGASSTSDYLAAGSTLADPTYGTLKMAFSGFAPDLTADERDLVTVDNVGNTGLKLTATDWRGNTLTDFTFAYTGTGTLNVQLNNSQTRKIHVEEGENVSLNDYLVVSPSGVSTTTKKHSQFGHLLQLTQISNFGTSTATLQLTDVFSGDVKTVSLKPAMYANAEFYMDGQRYIALNASTAPQNYGGFAFIWDSGASRPASGGLATTGTFHTLFPVIKLKGGEFLTFVHNETLEDISNLTTSIDREVLIELPTGILNISAYGGVGGWIYMDGTNISLSGGLINAEYTVNNLDNNGVDYIVRYSYGNVTPLNISAIKVAEAQGDAGTSSEGGVGVLLVTELDNRTLREGIVIDSDRSTLNTNYIGVNSPNMTGVSYSASRTDDSSVTDYMQAPYGTYVYYDSDGQGIAKIYYPDTQAIGTVAFGSDPTFTTTSGTTASTVEEAVPITTPVAKFESELGDGSTLTRDVILLGGPCAMGTLVGALLASEETTCENFCTKYPDGMIQEFTNAFGSGQKALVVAGCTAAQTRSLAADVLGGTMSFPV